MKRYARFRSFIAAFCIMLILLLAGLAFFIADANTRRVAFGGDGLPDVHLEEWDINHLPDWVCKGFNLLPAPARLLCCIPETLGLALPRKWDEEEHAPRLPSVAAGHRQEGYS